MRRGSPDPARLARLIEEGVSPKAIADRYGVARATVYQWLKSAGIDWPRRRAKPLGAWGEGAATPGLRPDRRWKP